jgi:S1-C subfamily serine protease
MKKLLGIVVLGLLLSGNAYAEIIKFKCINDNPPKNTTYTKIEYTLDTEKKTIYSNYVWFVKKKKSTYSRYLNIEDFNENNVIYSYPDYDGSLFKFDYVNAPYVSKNISGKGSSVTCSKLISTAEKPKKQEPKKKKPKPSPDDNKIVAAGSGSGFIVSKDGTVITNYHVIEGCELNKVSYKGSQLEAKVLSIDKVNDIAILKTNINSDTAFAVSNEDVSLLEDVVVAGFPLGKQISSAIKTHKGVVTALAGAGDNYSFFQTDAAINQGNSGGPIINQKGNVIGIAVQTWVEEGVQGVHFGIKSSTLKTFASANGLKFLAPNNRDLSNKELGKLITENTVYVECHMTIAKIKKMIAEAENKKAFFKDYQ